MKNNTKPINFFLLTVVLMAWFNMSFSKSVNAQGYCGDRFNGLSVLALNTGFSLEIGLWPTEEQRFGFFVGTGMQTQTSYNNWTKKTDTHPTLHGYIKGQYFLMDHVSITGLVGEKDMFADLWYGMGIKLYMPTAQTRKYVMILEPTYTNLGWKVFMGLGIAL